MFRWAKKKEKNRRPQGKIYNIQLTCEFMYNIQYCDG